MSGISLDYVNYKIEEAAKKIISRSHLSPDGVILRAFAEHLLKISKLCHKIEWNLDDDHSLKQKDIDDIIDAIGNRPLITKMVEEAREAHSNLSKFLDDFSLK